MDYMDIDEESNISARDSVENDSFENKFVDKISNDQKTNTIHSQEDSAIVDLTKQNGPAQAFENANCKVSFSSDRGKGIDFLSNSRPEKTVSARRVSGQKRLVRNGCISPHNIAKAKESAENNDNSNEFGNRDLISEANDCFRIRGKGVINYFARKGPNARTTNFSSRNSNLGGQSGRSNGHHQAENTLSKRQKPVSNSSNHGLRILDPVIEVDDFTPEMRNNGSRIVGGSCSNDDESDFRAIQVEADEILARELQEELYNEVPVFGVDEFDSHIALAFQQEDDSHQSVFDRSHREFHPRGSSVTNSYIQAESSSSQNPSVGRDTEARVPTSTIVARLRDRFLGQPSTASSSSSSSSSSSFSRINSLFPPNMDVDMRIHILEALEELSDMEMFGDLQVDRDFNENDYEMLLALDENNRHFGATPAQINGLPQSTVQSENLEETCAICLDNPSTGDTLRHLPCLHKFHKDCIDPWLRRRTSCPVCKSSITPT